MNIHRHPADRRKARGEFFYNLEILVEYIFPVFCIFAKPLVFAFKHQCQYLPMKRVQKIDNHQGVIFLIIFKPTITLTEF
jgi:hypothetical protein